MRAAQRRVSLSAVRARAGRSRCEGPGCLVRRRVQGVQLLAGRHQQVRGVVLQQSREQVERIGGKARAMKC